MSEEPEKVPVLFEYCTQAWDAMAEEATLEPVEGGKDLLVYEGFITHLITTQLHLSIPYYTKITRALKAMDCIRQLRRGGSSTPSRWLLLKRPTLEDYKIGTALRLPTPLQQSTSDLGKRINELEEQVGALLDSAGTYTGGDSR